MIKVGLDGVRRTHLEPVLDLKKKSYALKF